MGMRGRGRGRVPTTRRPRMPMHVVDLAEDVTGQEADASAPPTDGVVHQDAGTFESDPPAPQSAPQPPPPDAVVIDLENPPPGSS